MTCDLLIAGGGPAGAFASLTARRAGLRVAMVDAGEGIARPRVGEVIPPHGRRLLESAGVLSMLDPTDYLESCGTRSAWGSASPAATDFMMSPLGPGLHLDRAALNRALLAAAAAAGADIIPAARAVDVRRETGAWQITVAVDGRTRVLSAATFLDCTGYQARLARRLGARRVPAAAPHTAIVAWLDTSEDSDRDATLLVEAAADGWWYTARLPRGSRVVGYITRRSSPALRQAAIAAGWQGLVDRTVHVSAICRSHGYVLRRPPAIVVAACSRLDRMAGADWASAGDAAASFDPLSAQGILTAMLSGKFAASAIAARLRGDNGAALAGYARGLEGIHEEHVRACRDYYAAETRWPASPFWKPYAGPDRFPIRTFVA